MGRHRPDVETNEDGDTVRISGKIPSLPEINLDRGSRTFERDSGGIQGFEYFGTVPEEDN